VIARLAAENRSVLLAFSCGKDSIATWIALEDAGIEIVPCYLWYVPHLQFIEEELAYFEDVFGKRINRYPHPSFYRWLADCVMQPPERLRVLEAANFGKPDYDEMYQLIREDLGLSADTWVADGVRAADSIVRRASFTKHGVIKTAKRKVSPIADWLKAEVMEAIEHRGIKLPIDYEIFGRSFDGLDRRFTGPMREHLPKDYARLVEWFPLIECDLVRGGVDV
jgi:3'-phosphoadenosine 5'-phosphosulfate sulfotransferase (PAPS reductase)/FAD synthetase